MGTKKRAHRASCDRPRLIAFASRENLELVEAALGDLVTIVGCVDVQRLRRQYGVDVAHEVLRRLVVDRTGADARPSSRRHR